MQREVKEELAHHGGSLSQFLHPSFLLVLPCVGWSLLCVASPHPCLSSPETGSAAAGVRSQFALSQRNGRQGSN